MAADEARRVGDEVGLAVTVSADSTDAPADAAVERTIETTGGGEAGGAAAMPAAMGRYRIVRRIGAGGMGVVYEGHDPELDRPVAIKVLPERALARARLAERLQREARALARVTHPNVVSVYDVGVDEVGVYVVMQYVAGETLEAALARDQPDERAVLARFDAAGRGLAAAHAVELVHRDFKPSNVLVDADGTVRVTDFGLARVSDLAEAPAAVSGELGASMTRGELVGTPAYMAPEQFRGGPITAATDQFSFCVALWHALCGARPFAGGSVDEIREAVLAGAVVAPPARLPRRVEAVLRRGLAVDPAARYPTMNALLAALAPRRGPRAAAAIGLGVAGLAAAALVAWGALRPRARPPVPAAAITRGAGSGPAAVAPPAVAITHTGGCAYSPAFIDADTVVYDVSATGDGTMDLYRLDLAPGAAPVQLTKDDGWEWRAAPGRPPQEIVFLVQGGARDGTEALDLATGARRPITDIGGAIVFAAGSYFHAPAKGTVLRRIDDAGDRIFLALPEGRNADTMVASPDGTRLAILFRRRGTAARLCTVAIDRAVVECLEVKPDGGRPAFSADGTALYYNAAERVGVERVDLASGAVTSASLGRPSTGGAAIAPGGGVMVFSDCGKRTAIFDLVADPATSLGAGHITHPAVGPGGALAYVRFEGPRRTVVVRHPDGRVEDVVVRESGQLTDVAFSPDGRRVAYVATGVDEPGIYLVTIGPRVEVNRLTEGQAEERPVFAGGRLVFNRRTGDGTPQLLQVELDGRGERAASPRPRFIIGVDLVRDRVLVGSPGREHLYWWSPATGAEGPGPVLPTEDVPVGLALSPGGDWLLLQAGNSGQDVWRIPLVGRGRAPEHVIALPADATATIGAIDDRGHPIVAVDRWAGELWLARPAEGARW